MNLFKEFVYRFEYTCVSSRKLKNKEILSLDLNNLRLSKIRQLINIHDMLNHSSFKELNKQGIVGIYGSFAAGKDTFQSDIDLWFYAKDHTNALKLKNITRKIETDFRKEVRLLLLTDKKIKDLKENDPEFYFRLKLTSAGEDIFD